MGKQWMIHRPRKSISLAPLADTSDHGEWPLAPTLTQTSTRLGGQANNLQVMLSIRLQLYFTADQVVVASATATILDLRHVL